MEPVDPHEGRLTDGKGGYFCGRLLERVEGLCVGGIWNGRELMGYCGAERNTAIHEAVQRVVEAALAWDCARLLAVQLRANRAACVCVNETEAEPDVGYWGRSPCWKTYRQSAPDDVELLPRSEWCAPCLKRQIIHEQYRSAMKARGAAARSLQRRTAALRATPATDGGTTP